MNAVRISHLSKRYGTRTVLDEFELRVEAGSTVAILGASGCGKSTLLRCAGGLERPDSGFVDIAGEIGFVFQEPRLMPWLDVRANVAFAARDATERARVPGVLDLVGLSAASTLLPKQLSGGMAQRAALARSLLRGPKVLFLDEPLSALDALLRLELQTALARILRETGCTALLVTHDVDEAIYLADRAIVLAGSPARSVLDLEIPSNARRSRFADITRERVALLAALGVGGGEGPEAISASGAD